MRATTGERGTEAKEALLLSIGCGKGLIRTSWLRLFRHHPESLRQAERAHLAVSKGAETRPSRYVWNAAKSTNLGQSRLGVMPANR